MAFAANDPGHLAEHNRLVTEQGAWTSYTPVLTGLGSNPVLGTGSVQAGRYQQNGKTVRWKAFIRFGTSGATFGTGAYQVSLPPVAAASSMSMASGSHIIGMAEMVDDSTSNGYAGIAQLATGSTTLVWIRSHAAGFISLTVPFTFAISDYIKVSGEYEAA